nr:tRNA (adenosine(37)-N6)-threonylcarbamoyltransferase complex dimerization subunit type 1 TsaB [uncultured Dongia sp.]
MSAETTTQPVEDRLILALDAAGAICSVALGAIGRDGLRVLASRKVEQRHGQATILVPMVAEVMAEAQRALTDLAALAVGIGPGGFTGLRIALSTARGFGLALGKPVIGITNFQAAAATLSPASRAAHPGDMLVMIDSRREEPFVALLGSDLQLRDAPRFMTMSEIARLIETSAPAIITGDGLDLWQADLPAAAHRIAAAADAAAILRLAADPAQRFAHDPAPLYLREPDVSLPKAV